MSDSCIITLIICILIGLIFILLFLAYILHYRQNKEELILQKINLILNKIPMNEKIKIIFDKKSISCSTEVNDKNEESLSNSTTSAK